jgi:hypothetical protein
VADGEGSGGEIHGDQFDPKHVQATGIWSDLFKKVNKKTKLLEDEEEEQKGMMAEFKE